MAYFYDVFETFRSLSSVCGRGKQGRSSLLLILPSFLLLIKRSLTHTRTQWASVSLVEGYAEPHSLALKRVETVVGGCSSLS